MKVIFFGTSSFGIPALESLKRASMAPVLIVSTPDKPKGRKLHLSPTPVKEWAKNNGIEVITPDTLNNKDTIHALKEKNADVYIVASYGKIIPKEILDIPSKGVINIHPSLLPQFRGPSPIQSTILKNAPAGVTLMLTDEEIDHGPVLAKRTLETSSITIQETNKSEIQNYKPTYKEFEKVLAKLGAEMLVETLPKWMRGEIEPQEQNHAEATFTKKITKDDGRINWNEPAEIIERKIRALNPWPGTYTFYEKDGGKIRLLITKAHIEKIDGQTVPGTVTKTKNGECAVAASDDLIVVDGIKPEGKKEMPGKEFMRGNQSIMEKTLYS